MRLSPGTRQKLRYLLVGAWNTVFGFALFSLAYALFHTRINYIVLNMACSEIAIINAYLGYKFLVFRTTQPWLPELGRFHFSYVVAIALSTALLWLLVSKAHLHPILAQGISSVVVVCCSYVMHRFFSFAN